MQRRKFLKKMLGAGALVAAAPAVALAKETDNEKCLDNGVVRGHSPKKEILYRMTKYWEIYYKNAI